MTNREHDANSGAQRLRVLLVDDDPFVLSMLSMILESQDDLAVVAHVQDGDQAVAAVSSHAPDVVVMDIRMARMAGLAATAAVRALPRAPKVLVLTSFDLDEYVFDALAAGASGFLLKESDPSDIINGVRVVAAGNAMLSPSTTRALIEHYVTARASPRRRAAARKLDALTDREREVVVAVAQGKSNAAIAAELFMSEATVKTHMTRTFAKLDVGSRVQLTIFAYEAGLVGV